ncbi:MAG: hypothetical protein UHK60_10280 [Acutalibacteraceae bacterium]|nr:hypothetical protein [Acutalibacteraceae bacterium]
MSLSKSLGADKTADKAVYQLCGLNGLFIKSDFRPLNNQRVVPFR